MDSPSDDDQLEQEVTVEVFPDTVTEIIYLPDTVSHESSYYVPSEEELETDESNEYEIGSVDTTKLPNRDLVLDQTETFVLLSADSDLLNSDTVFLHQVNSEDDMTLAEQFDCSKCQYKANSFEILEEHQLVAHKPQLCTVCGKTFPKENLLSRHFKEDHMVYNCAVCNVECTGRKSYSSHIRQHEQKKYACYTCSASFGSGDKLMNHMETHGTVLLYACNKCDEAFSSTNEVSLHLRQVHTSKNKSDSRKRDACQNTNKSNIEIKPR